MAGENPKDGTKSLEARYTNCIKVGHNDAEFIFDFGQFYAKEDEPRFHTRIATAPLYAKSFSKALQTSIESYETSYGRIQSEGSSEKRKT